MKVEPKPESKTYQESLLFTAEEDRWSKEPRTKLWEMFIEYPVGSEAVKLTITEGIHKLPEKQVNAVTTHKNLEDLLAYVNPIRNAKLHDRYLIGVMKGLRPEGLTKLVDPFDL
jgi:hypothetical protein